MVVQTRSEEEPHGISGYRTPRDMHARNLPFQPKRSRSEDHPVIRFVCLCSASLGAAQPFDGFEQLTAHLGAGYRAPRRLYFHPHPYAFRV